jgi:putative endonuclease
MWFVYILECSDGTLYTGITTDMNKRLLTHNKGKGAKYTKVRLPVVLRACFEAENRSLASKEEYRIKQLRRQDKISLIKEYMSTTLTGIEKDLIHEMMDFISDMPTMFEPLQRKMEQKYGIDEESFYEIKNDLKLKIKPEN